RGRPLEQPDKLLERLQPQGRGPEDGVLEGVDDPEQQVGDPDLVAGRWRQVRDRQRERPAGLLEKTFDVGHAHIPSSPQEIKPGTRKCNASAVFQLDRGRTSKTLYPQGGRSR